MTGLPGRKSRKVAPDAGIVVAGSEMRKMAADMSGKVDLGTDLVQTAEGMSPDHRDHTAVQRAAEGYLLAVVVEK